MTPILFIGILGICLSVGILCMLVDEERIGVWFLLVALGMLVWAHVAVIAHNIHKNQPAPVSAINPE